MREAAYAGVPVLATPLFGDQMYNYMQLRERGIARRMDITRVAEQPEMLVDAIGEMLSNQEYASKAKEVSSKLRAAPFPAQERLVKWVEFAAEFPDGLPELNLPGDEELGPLVYYSIDVILASVVMLLVLGGIAVIILRTVVKAVLALLASGEHGDGEKKTQ